jgi:hypothetical protein
MASPETQIARESDTTTAMRIRRAARTDQMKRDHQHQLPNAAAPGVRGMENPPAATVMAVTMGESTDTATAPATKIRNPDPRARAAVTGTATLNTALRALEAVTATEMPIAIRDLYPTHHPRR